MFNSRIMVVDGSAVSREIVARIVNNVAEEATVTVCATGEEALGQLETGQYGLFLIAPTLADMDGLDLCRRLRNSESHRSTPVVVIASDSNERLLKQGFDAGVTDYFDKSKGYPAFTRFIKDFCRRSTGHVGRVLYVEDSMTAATMTLRILERHGLEVTHVDSAEAAISLLEERHNEDSDTTAFDVVLTDYFLQQAMTGGDLLQAVRSRYSQQELPVLMMTGSDDARTQVATFHAGANDFIHKPLAAEVLMARLRSLLLIKQQYEALLRQTKKVEQVAATDTLTGVRNRHYMLEHGEAYLAESGNSPFWAMIIDIDHFKLFNKEHGHLTGDHVLAAMGELLNRFYPDAMVVRFGGEEFAVLLPKALRSDALRRAEEMRRAAAALCPDGVPFTISIGIAGTEDHRTANLNTLLSIADKALFASKEQGRNRTYLTTSDDYPVPVEPYLVQA